MGEQGRLTAWNDDRGFGFITPLHGESRLFVHISEFPRQQRRPLLNDLVVYTPSQDDSGRPRATGVGYLIPALEQAASSGDPDAMVDLAILIVGEDRTRAIKLFEQAATRGEFNAMNWLAYLIKDDDRQRAAELFEQAVGLGHTNAMVNLADLIVGEDRARAEGLLEQAASLGDPDAMVKLANLIVGEDRSGAIELFEQAASSGDPAAMVELAIMIRGEDGTRAIKLFEQAATRGNSRAMDWLACLVVDDDRRRAVKLLEQATALGNTNAMINLANLMVGEDRARAEGLLEQAVSHGNPAAMVKLANLIAGEERERASKLLEQAVSLEDPAAMVELAILIRDEDRARAIKLFERTAARGNSNAMNWLAYLIKDDDRQRAAELFEQAVGLGHTNAMVNLADLIVGEDRARAEGLLEQAASLGDSLARDRLAQLQQDCHSLRDGPAAGETYRIVRRAGLKRCPRCGALAVSKSLWSDDDYCFPKKGGCGAEFPNLTIVADGLTRGVALDPYHSGSSRSFFGELVSRMKYHSMSDAEKLALVDQAVGEIKKRAAVEDLVNGASNLLVVPAPSSKHRTVQHVYDIAKRVAGSDYRYLEALVKTTSAESKTMKHGGEYEEGDFRCDYQLQGYSVLLIDDTYGEGATLKACIEVLRESGADGIYFLSLCKNTRGGIKQSDNHQDADYGDDIPF